MYFFLPDISIWKTYNLLDMSSMFENCRTLISLPDISKWIVSKVKYMESTFTKCICLISLPDLSIWKTYNLTNFNEMFSEWISLSYPPDTFKWKFSFFHISNNIYDNCFSSINLPEISYKKNENQKTKSYKWEFKFI